MADKFEEHISTLVEMFGDIDLIRASARFNQVGKDISVLITEYLDRGYPELTPSVSASLLTSANFLKVQEAVPRPYQLFAPIFLTNEFPKLNKNFITSKLKEFNSHIYPTFRFIYKKYFLCDCELHPEDEDGKVIYELDNEVKNNYSAAASPKRGIEIEQYRALKAYPSLANELVFISKKRQSYQLKIAAIKTFINERWKILDVYVEEKRKSLERDVPFPLIECPICHYTYLQEELRCCRGDHSVCRDCLRQHIVKNCIPNGVSKVKCMIRGCQLEYIVEMVRVTLGGKEFQNFNKILMQDELSCLSNDPNIHTCPFCLVFRVHSKEKLEILNCPLCNKIMCLLCKKEVSTHPDGKCPVRKVTEDQDEQMAKETYDAQNLAETERIRRQSIQAEDDEAFARRLDEEQRNKARAEEMRKEEIRKQQQREAEERLRREREAAEAARRKAEKEEKEREEWELKLRVFVQAKMDDAVIRRCPKQTCRKQIIKTGACNHMTCICGYHFCYECGRACEDQAHPSNHFKPGGCNHNTGSDQKAVDARMDAERQRKARDEGEREWRANNPTCPANVRLRL